MSEPVTEPDGTNIAFPRLPHSRLEPTLAGITDSLKFEPEDWSDPSNRL